MAFVEKLRKLSVVLVLFLCLALHPDFLGVPVDDSTSYPVQGLSACQDEIPSGDLVELSTFPFDLDLLFWPDNLTTRNERLNEIGNGSTEWMIAPWGAHFISGHTEGVDHWYLSPYRRLELRAPTNGVLERLELLNGTIFEVNGEELVADVYLVYNIGNYCRLKFIYCDLLKTIYDEIQQTHTYTFTENELIGYNHIYPALEKPGQGIDFFYSYRQCNICPYFALSSELQTDITAYYDLQYERAKIGGTYPESNICNAIDIGIENTVWGVWFYHTGPYDDVLGSEGAFRTDLESFTFFSRTLANSETFYRNPAGFSPGNLASDVIGVYTDHYSDASETGFKNLGMSLIKLYSGSFTDGILEMVPEYGNEWWEASNQSIYVRILVDERNAGLADDTLTLEYFASPSEAQAGFTDDKITCIRYIPQFDEWDLRPILQLAPVIIVGLGLVIALVLIVIIIKRRKK